MPTAVIVGASSGIGEALARRLAREGWRLGLAARRLDRLQALAAELGPQTLVAEIDLTQPEPARTELAKLIDRLGGADLVVLSSGVGHLNPALEWAPEHETIAVNALGFAAAAQVAMTGFLACGSGHLVGISSVAKERGSGQAAAYAATKAFVSVYLDGLRDLAKHSRKPIWVTEVAPGFVRTPMMQADKPFWVASADTAAEAILRAVRRRAKHAWITPRWGLIAFLLRHLPRPG